MDYKKFSKSIIHVTNDVVTLEQYLSKVLEVVRSCDRKILNWQDMIDILTLNISYKKKTKVGNEKKRVIKILERQIKDLKDMQENGDLDKEFKYFGLTSPSKQIWYNFDTSSYLRCATAGLFQKRIENCDWNILEHFFLLGQIYE